MEDNKEMIQEINGKPVNFAKALPMKLGDIRKMKKLGVDFNEFQAASKEERMPDVDMLFSFILVMAQKINADINEEDIDSLNIDDIAPVFQTMFSDDATGEIDRPT